MTDRYVYWRSLPKLDLDGSIKPGNGAATTPIVDQPECGFYRLKRGDRYVPVAVWPVGSALGIKIGSEVVGDIGTEQWTWYSHNPITEGLYRAVAEKGQPWPDSDPTVTAILAAESVKKIDMVEKSTTKPAPETITVYGSDPITEFREQIKTALGGIKIYAKIETDERDVQALSLRNMLNELASDADKAREAEKAPYFKKVKEIDGKWMPLIKEAREGAGEIKKARDEWADSKRQAAIDAQRRADEALAEQMREAAEKGEPTEPISAPPPQSNLPPPTTQVRPTYGRASSTGTAIVVTDVDYDKMFADLKKRPELWDRFKEIMLDFAQKCASKGIILDGVKTRERANTR